MRPEPLTRFGGTEVLDQACPLLWPDGSAIALHPVRLNGCDSLFIRAIQLEGGAWIVFDVRKLWRPLATELPMMPARDQAGTIRFTLQQQFRTAADVRERASNCAELYWVPSAEREAA